MEVQKGKGIKAKGNELAVRQGRQGLREGEGVGQEGLDMRDGG